jgi:hypothetical protein
MKELLIKLNACDEAIEWAGDRTIEEIVKDCDRGDWLLWLAKKIDIELQPLTLAKGHCANTVRHLMKNERSIKAVDMAIAFGEGRATMEELNNAATYAAAFEACGCCCLLGLMLLLLFMPLMLLLMLLLLVLMLLLLVMLLDAATATFAAAYAAGDAAFYPAYAADAAYAAKKQNQKETAEICRKYIGQLIIDKCNELNTKEK